MTADTARAVVDMDVEIEAIFGRPIFFSRAGQPITFSMFGELLNDLSYLRVADTRIGRINRRRWTRCRIATIWRGMNTSQEPEPAIFTTSIVGGPLDGHEWSYTSEEDALRGHAAAKSRNAMAIYLRIHHGRSSLVFREPKPKPRYKYRTHGQRRRG